MPIAETATIAPTAIVEPGVEVGANTQIWHHCLIRAGTRIGANCKIGAMTSMDFGGVVVGDNVKIQTSCHIGRPTIIEDGVFMGPMAMCPNDPYPRAIMPDGRPKTDDDWEPKQTRVCYGASVGMMAVLLPGITVGRWALVGSGAIVAHDVPDRAIVVGQPAKIVGYACDCGAPMDRIDYVYTCRVCPRSYPGFEPEPIMELVGG